MHPYIHIKPTTIHLSLSPLLLPDLACLVSPTMDDKPSPLHRVRQGLTKSDSTASVGGASIKSCDSVSVIGSHPLGTLHVHQLSDPASQLDGDEDDDDDDDDIPPPLDPPVNNGAVSVSHKATHTKSISGPFVHYLGGGDVVLVLGLPEVFIVGFDSVSFTAKHFGGVRDIPPGPHFFWVAHPGGLSTRCGFWIVSTGVESVHVVQWDRYNEVLGEPARAEARIQADNIGAIHSKLVPYHDPSAVNAVSGDLSQASSDKNIRMWQQLTSKVTKTVLDHVTEQQDGNWMVHTGDRVKGSLLMTAEMELDNSISNPLLKGRDLNFTFNQLSRTYTIENTGADRTLEATDSTPYILSLIDAPDSSLYPDAIVGEFQFSFVVGMHLGNDACIQQWWHMLLKVFLRAHLLLAKRPNLAATFIRSLTAQLSYATSWLDDSVLDYADSQTKNLRLALTVYKRRLEEFLNGLCDKALPDQLAVGTAFAGLEAVVTEALDWDLKADYLRRGNVTLEDGEQIELEHADFADEDERGEWAPKIVDIDESGRQRDLVSWND